MDDAIVKEIDAIKTVLTALEPLPADARERVIQYISTHLHIRSSLPAVASAAALMPAAPASIAALPAATPAAQVPTHIKTFKEQKKPRSANEMAALVAYYLAELVPPEQRKATVTARDLQTYFKIGDFPLPGQMRWTLPNAKTAGYFDSAGGGEYRLNAVGHNLVAHSMPRGASSESAPKRRSAKRVPRKKAKAKKR